MSIYVSELLPNPAGKDAGNEWIEVCNNGSQSKSLAGWKLQDASAKKFTIANTSVVPQSCVVFGNTETKISLNNDKEIISLFNMDGVSQDSVSYSGTIKDDQSLARATPTGELQITTSPTKGEIQNIITAPEAQMTQDTKTEIENKIIATTSQNGLWDVENGVQTQILTSGINMWQVILIGVCVAGILTALFMKVVIELRKEQSYDSRNRKH
ncbi:MAG: lamin tail domain-containing protein [Candidatus Paceibacterota bacterium]